MDNSNYSSLLHPRKREKSVESSLLQSSIGSGSKTPRFNNKRVSTVRKKNKKISVIQSQDMTKVK